MSDSIPEVKAVERHATNPWKWQDADGFVQACEVRAGQKTLFCSGQLSVDGDGKVLHVGDMRAQMNAALDNVETLIKAAGYELTDIVRVNVYSTDIDQSLQNWDVILTRLTQKGIKFSCTLLGVARLAWPETMVEIEVTAVA